jgi:hypothetical protein
MGFRTIAQGGGVNQNRVVVRYQDFLPGQGVFHLSLAGAAPGSRPVEIETSELKALFFVKDFAGNPLHDERQEFDEAHKTVGRKIRVVFKDGELLVGTTQDYHTGQLGFYILPADRQSNIERCFVVTAATQEVAFA